MPATAMIVSRAQWTGLPIPEKYSASRKDAVIRVDAARERNFFIVFSWSFFIPETALQPQRSQRTQRCKREKMK
jgi:hypothetical protein